MSGRVLEPDRKLTAEMKRDNILYQLTNGKPLMMAFKLFGLKKLLHKGFKWKKCGVCHIVFNLK